MRSVVLALLLVPTLAFAEIGPRSFLGSIEHRYGVGSEDPLPGGDVEMPPSIATNGDTFFAVWMEARDRWVIRGTRIDANGRSLDPEGITIAGGLFPQVVWNGYAWALIWEEGDDLAYHGQLFDTNGRAIGEPVTIIRSESFYYPNIAASRDRIALLNRNKIVLLDPELHVVREREVSVWAQAIASDGNDFMVALNEDRHRLLHLDDDARPIGSHDLEESAVDRMKIVWSGDRYWVLERDSLGGVYGTVTIVRRDGTTERAIGLGRARRYDTLGAGAGCGFVYGADLNDTSKVWRISASGSVTASRTGAAILALAANDHGDTIAIWGTGGFWGQSPLRSGRLRPTDGVPEDLGDWLVRNPAATRGVSSDVAGRSTRIAFIEDLGAHENVIVHDAVSGTRIVIDDGESNNYKYATALATNGSSTLVVWSGLRRPVLDAFLDAAMLSRSGLVHAHIRIAAPFVPIVPAAAWTGSAYVVVWSDGGLRMASVREDGTVSAPITIARARSGFDESPVLASGAGISLLVWKERDGHGNSRLLATRLDRNGTPLDVVPLVLFAGQEGSEVLTPAVTWNGRSFVAAWNPIDAIEVARIETDGTVIPNGRLPRTSGVPSLTSDGTHTYLMHTPWSNRNRFDVERLDDDGTLTWLGGDTIDRPMPIPLLAHVPGLGVVILSDDANAETEWTRQVWMRTLTNVPVATTRRHG